MKLFYTLLNILFIPFILIPFLFVLNLIDSLYIGNKILAYNGDFNFDIFYILIFYFLLGVSSLLSIFKLKFSKYNLIVLLVKLFSTVALIVFIWTEFKPIELYKNISTTIILSLYITVSLIYYIRILRKHF